MAHLVHLGAARVGRVPRPLQRPERERAARRPPVAMRAAVAVLAVLLLDGAVGLGALLVHPAWFSGLRREQATARAPRRLAAAPSVPTSSASRRGATSARADEGAGLDLVGATPSVTTYSVPDASYTIAFVVDQPCWVALRTPPGAAAPTFAATLVPGQPTAITVHGAASAMVAARALAIEVRHGSHVLGRIVAPVVGMTYRLVPRAVGPGGASQA